MAKKKVELLINEGNRALAVFDYDTALKSFDKARKEEKDSAEAHFGYAEAALGKENIPVEDVVKAYENAIAKDETNAFYHARLGAFLIDIGKYEDATAHYDKAAELDPEGAPYYYSELAIEYYQNWIGTKGDTASFVEKARTKKLVLEYLLKSIDLDKDTAKALLK